MNGEPPPFRAARAILPILIALLAAATTVSGQESIGVVETLTVAGEELPEASDATHELRLFLYTFRGGRWRSGDIVMATWEGARFLAQCGVVLAGAELRLIDAPRRFHVYSTPVSRELLRSLSATKPAIFFVEDTQSEPAYEAESIGRENAKTRPELTDTTWVTYGARDLSRAVAHELVHLLSDSGGHSEEPGNLMRMDTDPENTRLNDAQCQRLRATGEANGLLKKK